jgi:hypothetical protein
MKLSKRARQGLIDSIAAWEYKKKQLALSDVLITPAACPLCKLYNSYNEVHCHHSDCMHCPIYKTTGERYCMGSPYVQASEALEVWDDASLWDHDERPARAKFRRACTKMIKFMQNILEER